jgi:hypothetical protein
MLSLIRIKKFCDNEKLFFFFFFLQFNDWILTGFQIKGIAVFFFLYAQRTVFQQDDKNVLATADIGMNRSRHVVRFTRSQRPDCGK